MVGLSKILLNIINHKRECGDKTEKDSDSCYAGIYHHEYSLSKCWQLW